MRPASKICFIVSYVEKSLPLEWVVKRLVGKYELTFVVLNPKPSAMKGFLEANDVHYVHVFYRGKGTFLSALWQVMRVFRRERFGVVHAHLFDATLIGLTAAWLTGIEKRIYTRHNSTYHQKYFPRSVILDRWANRMATHIISISQATDYALAAENAPLGKIRKVPHGFDFSEFLRTDRHLVSKVQEKWAIPDAHPRIGVVARQIEWKGVQFAVTAFRQLLDHFPQAILILANANGPYASAIRKLLDGIPRGHVVEIPFEEDIASVYRLMDVFVHVPIDPYCEAFGQTYIEAWSMGLPSVITVSGIAVEVARHKENAWIVNYQQSQDIVEGIRALLSDPELGRRLSSRAYGDVINRFAIDNVMPLLEKVYDE